MSKARRVREARKQRERREEEQVELDARLRATRALQIAGQPRLRTGYQLQVLAQVDLPDGRMLIYPAPQIGAFSLVEAKRLRDDAEGCRKRLLAEAKPRPNESGAYQPADTGEVLDVIAALYSAVLFSFAAIESLANERIERLPVGTTWKNRRGERFCPMKCVWSG